MNKLKILIVAANVSKRMGGEANKIFIYLSKFQKKGHLVWLICHSRVREELQRELMPEELSHVRFAKDTQLQIWIWKISQMFPSRIQELIFDQILNLLFQLDARQIAKQLILDEEIQVVFQPTPNTPLAPSALYNLEIPVVMGPLSGGMQFPPSLNLDSRSTRWFVSFGQKFAVLLSYLAPGKRFADEVLVANQKTRMLLPKNCRGRIHENIVECGVDLDVWNSSSDSTAPLDRQTVRFIYAGRLVDWKGVNYLLDAFKLVVDQMDAFLLIVGKGEERQALESQAKHLGIANSVNFCGWLTREEIKTYFADSDVFVMPSLRESCGASILEAMAMGLPVIVSDWGGPALLVDETCGIKVKPSSSEEFINGLAEAMLRLAQSPDYRASLAKNGLKRIKANQFDWDSKVDYILDIFLTAGNHRALK